MFRIKKHLFLIVFYLLFTILHFDCLHAQQEKGKQGTESTEKNSPSFSIKESNVQLAPAAASGEQAETATGSMNKSADGAQPHLAIDAPHYDAGELWEGEDIIHAFTVRNTGTAQLGITNVKAG